LIAAFSIGLFEVPVSGFSARSITVLWQTALVRFLTFGRIGHTMIVIAATLIRLPQFKFLATLAGFLVKGSKPVWYMRVATSNVGCFKSGRFHVSASAKSTTNTHGHPSNAYGSATLW
jgi:hypothetical protein